jgi:hypothetical protein
MTLVPSMAEPQLYNFLTSYLKNAQFFKFLYRTKILILGDVVLCATMRKYLRGKTVHFDRGNKRKIPKRKIPKRKTDPQTGTTC